nr:Retrovirus-related Pol polyprotein from transposon TNT 1-94 [Ipomoea batatas]
MAWNGASTRPPTAPSAQTFPPAATTPMNSVLNSIPSGIPNSNSAGATFDPNDAANPFYLHPNENPSLVLVLQRDNMTYSSPLEVPGAVAPQANLIAANFAPNTQLEDGASQGPSQTIETSNSNGHAELDSHRSDLIVEGDISQRPSQTVETRNTDDHTELDSHRSDLSQGDSNLRQSVLPQSDHSLAQPKRSSRQTSRPTYLRDYDCSLPTTRTSPHTLSTVLSYKRMSPGFKAFATNILGIQEPKSYNEAIHHESGKKSEERNGLSKNSRIIPDSPKENVKLIYEYSLANQWVPFSIHAPHATLMVPFDTTTGKKSEERNGLSKNSRIIPDSPKENVNYVCPLKKFVLFWCTLVKCSKTECKAEAVIGVGTEKEWVSGNWILEGKIGFEDSKEEEDLSCKDHVLILVLLKRDSLLEKVNVGSKHVHTLVKK